MHLELIRSPREDQPGYFCYLVKSERVDGKPRNKRVYSFGLMPLERIPYLKAALDDKCDPHETYARVREKLFGKGSPGGGKEEEGDGE